MDPRIGTLNQNGKTVYYAFLNGYNHPETQGSRDEIEVALGIRVTSPKPVVKTERKPVKKPTVLRDYVVTLLWQGGQPEEITVEALNHADAIKKGRDWKNTEYGRTRSCDTLPCKFKARLATDD